MHTYITNMHTYIMCVYPKYLYYHTCMHASLLYLCTLFLGLNYLPKKRVPVYNSIPACYIDECHVHGPQCTHNTINLWMPVYIPPTDNESTYMYVAGDVEQGKARSCLGTLTRSSCFLTTSNCMYSHCTYCLQQHIQLHV